MKRNIIERAEYSPSNLRFTDNSESAEKDDWHCYEASRPDSTRHGVKCFDCFEWRVSITCRCLDINTGTSNPERPVPSIVLGSISIHAAETVRKVRYRCVYLWDTRIHCVSRRRERTHSTVKKLFAFIASRESIIEQRDKCLSSILPYIFTINV